MIIAAWNVRGFNTTHRRREVLPLCNKRKIDIFGVLETKIKDGNISKFTMRLLQQTATAQDQLDEVLLFKKVFKAKLMEEEAAQQKSRILWLQKGGLNTSFYHRKAKVHKLVNTISRLWNEDEVWMDDPSLIS